MRKSMTVVVDIEGRDKGKVFIVNEMPPIETDRWANQVLCLIAQYMTIPDHVVAGGIAGLAQVGPQVLKSGIPFEQIQPLLDKMLTCVKVIRDPKMPNMHFDIIPDTDIEEISTIWLLRSKVWEVHTGFSWADALSRLKTMWESAMKSKGSPDMSTSPARSPRSSRRAKQP